MISDDYYYTFIRYIEQNPIEAKIVDKMGEYPYTLGVLIANRQMPILCTHHSKLLQEIQQQKVITSDKVNRPAYQKTLKDYFKNTDRNDAIIIALADGYTQAGVAKFLGSLGRWFVRLLREGNCYFLGVANSTALLIPCIIR